MRKASTIRSAVYRRRRVADTQAWRARQKRGAAVYPIEIDGPTFDPMERFGGLEASKAHDRRRYVFYRVVCSAKAFRGPARSTTRR
jgi:hypothetical protein